MYEVDWLQSALDRLTDLWTSADGQRRADITAAAFVIERNLQQDPQEVGESRDRGRRICFFGPLAVTYRVDESSRLVTISDVRGLTRY